MYKAKNPNIRNIMIGVDFSVYLLRPPDLKISSIHTYILRNDGW